MGGLNGHGNGSKHKKGWVVLPITSRWNRIVGFLDALNVLDRCNGRVMAIQLMRCDECCVQVRWLKREVGQDRELTVVTTVTVL